jgi:CheY-like chemotaxis protein
LRQVILNLMGNAIKFTSQGEVSLFVTDEEHSEHGVTLKFAIRDTGVGIPIEKQHKIFQAFEQADGSTTRKYGGTGLGLAISTRIVQLMGGRIWVESTPGEGSTFYFTAQFTLVDHRSALALVAGFEEGRGVVRASIEDADDNYPLVLNLHADQPHGGIRILLAEDNVVNQKLAVIMLEKMGHTVVQAASGKDALEKWEQTRFDLVLMDVQMPEMDGFEATHEIRSREKLTGAHVPIVAMTANTMSGDRERCLKSGMDDYVGKPITSRELLRVVAKFGRQKVCKTGSADMGRTRQKSSAVNHGSPAD